ncbi:MAG: protease modulator HflK [Novosphingobium sp.]
MSESEGPKRGGRKTPDEPAQTPADTPEPGAATPAPETEPGPPATPEAPRNPWLPEGQAHAGKRRSASMDDLLRSHRPLPRRPLKPGSGPVLGLAVVGVVSAWLLSTSIHVLAQGERGLVTTFGRHVGTIGPGLSLTLPWPIQAVTRREVGKELVALLPDKEAETLMLTRDGELIDLRLQVRWRIDDLRQFTYALPDGEAALRRLADSAIRGAVAEISFDELRSGKRQAALQQGVAQRMQRVLDGWRAGITVSGIEVTAANPPARLADTFKKIGTANQEARKNHEVALTYAGQIKYNAEARARAFDKAYELYRIAPEVTRSRIYYDTIEKVLRNNPVVIGGTSAEITLPPPPAGKGGN